MTWWTSLSTTQQILVWLLGYIIAMAFNIFVLGHGVANGINRLQKTKEYARDRVRSPDKWIAVFTTAFAFVALFSIVGLPSTFVMPLGGAISAALFVIIVPWLQNSKFADSMAVYQATLDWKNTDWIVSPTDTREGYWDASNLSHAMLREPDGSVHHIPLKEFQMVTWTNRNKRTQSNPLGMQREDVEFVIPPNGPAVHAVKLLEDILDKTPGMVVDPDAGVLFETFEDVSPTGHKIVARYWVKSHEEDVSTRAFLNREVSKQFAHNNILFMSKNRVDWVQTKPADATVKAPAVVDLQAVKHETVADIVTKAQQAAIPEPVEIAMPIEAGAQAGAPATPVQPAAQAAPVPLPIWAVEGSPTYNAEIIKLYHQAASAGIPHEEAIKLAESNYANMQAAAASAQIPAATEEPVAEGQTYVLQAGEKLSDDGTMVLGQDGTPVSRLRPGMWVKDMLGAVLRKGQTQETGA